MIAPTKSTAVSRAGAPRRLVRSYSQALRIYRALKRYGSLHVAAPLCGVSRSWAQEWAADDPYVAYIFERASAVFTARSIAALQTERDAVLAQSHRFVAARRCQDFRDDKGRVEKALDKVTRTLVRFSHSERAKAVRE